jgi:UDP-glucose 4-epimerase
MNRKVLITGGAGYIGAHCALEVFNAGYIPIIIDNFSRSDRVLLDGLGKITNREFKVYEGNCLDLHTLENIFSAEKGFDCVMHFAAYKAVGESVEKPLDYFQNNVGSLMSVLQAMRAAKCEKLIFSSSCTVYGQPDTIPVNENTPFKRAESPYGATKQMCERIIEDVARTGLQVVSLRYFNPIGAHPSGLLGELPVGAPNNLVPYITQTAAGVRDMLTINGNDYNTPDGTCVRDFIHVVDLADAHVRAMEYLNAKSGSTPMYEAFNLGTGVGVSVMQLVNSFMKVTGVKVPFRIGPRRPGDVESVYADPSRANQVLKWKTRYSIEDSLLHAWQWEKTIRNLK